MALVQSKVREINGIMVNDIIVDEFVEGVEQRPLEKKHDILMHHSCFSSK